MKTLECLGRSNRGGRVVCGLIALAAVGLATGCATTSSGEKETAGEALQRMDQSVENTIMRLQNKTYNE